MYVEPYNGYIRTEIHDKETEEDQKQRYKEKTKVYERKAGKQKKRETKTPSCGQNKTFKKPWHGLEIPFLKSIKKSGFS